MLTILNHSMTATHPKHQNFPWTEVDFRLCLSLFASTKSLSIYILKRKKWITPCIVFPRSDEFERERVTTVCFVQLQMKTVYSTDLLAVYPMQVMIYRWWAEGFLHSSQQPRQRVPQIESTALSMTKARLQIGGNWLCSNLEKEGFQQVYLPKTCYI